MGWWNAGDGALVGDLPLDVLDGATNEVVAHYQKSWKRAPSLDEWQKLLAAALSSHLLERLTAERREGMPVVAEKPRKKLMVTLQVVDVQ